MILSRKLLVFNYISFTLISCWMDNCTILTHYRWYPFMLSNWLIEYAIATKKSDIISKNNWNYLGFPQPIRGRLQRTSGKWGGGGGWFWNFEHSRTGGGGWFVKVRTSKNLWKNRNSKISQRSLKLKLEIIIDRDSNMRAFTYDVCSNLGVSK